MEDEVEHLVAGWRQALPGVDVSPLEVLSWVSRLAHHLERQRSVVFARHDLETWTFDVLSALRRSGPPYHLSPGQLLAQTLVTSGTMTNRLNHLERRGLVRRKPDPKDARSVRVWLTADGRRRVEAASRISLSEKTPFSAASTTTKGRSWRIFSNQSWLRSSHSPLVAPRPTRARDHRSLTFPEGRRAPWRT